MYNLLLWKVAFFTCFKHFGPDIATVRQRSRVGYVSITVQFDKEFQFKAIGEALKILCASWL